MKRFAPKLITVIASVCALVHACKADEIEAVVVDESEVLVISDREKVELLENTDLEEAMSRRPDLSFRNVTIDGEVATVSLKDIQADEVESAEVSKAVTPDLDADLRGGGLNLRSRPTYGLEKRVFRASLDGRYDPILGAWDNEAGLSYGRSLGRVGFMVNGSVEDGLDGQESYRQDWLRLSGEAGEKFVIEEQQFQHSRTDEMEYKANATVDLLLHESIRLYLKGDYRDSDREVYRPRLYIRQSKGDYTNISDEGATVNGAHAERLISYWETDSSEYTMTTGGYLDFERLVIDFQLSYNDSVLSIPGIYSSKFTRKRLDLVYEGALTDFPVFSLQDPADADINAVETYVNDWFSRNQWNTGTQSWVSTANFKLPVSAGWFRGYLKTGFKLRGLDFEKLLWDEHYDNLNKSFTLDQVVGDYLLTDSLGRGFDHGPYADGIATARYFEDHPQDFQFNETRTREDSDPESYATGQDIHAGYGMLYFSFKDLRIIAGMRYEQTDLNYPANEVILDEEGDYLETRPVIDSNHYSNWFPGIHGRYDMSRVSLIGSWSNTISRPEFGLVVPYREVHREGELIEAGNPDLKPTLYTNYDFAVDYRLNGDDDVLSMELFYQTVEDIIYNEASLVSSGPYAGYEFETFRNGPSGDVYGLRLVWSQSIGNWLDFADGLYFNANYTYRVSETTYPGRPDEVLPMPRRPRNSFQLSVSYKHKRLFAQLELDYDQESLREINEEAPWRDTYLASGTRLDFSSSYRMSEGFRILFEVSNITESKRAESYYGSERLLTGYQYSPRQYRLGMKFDL